MSARYFILSAVLTAMIGHSGNTNAKPAVAVGELENPAAPRRPKSTVSETVLRDADKQSIQALIDETHNLIQGPEFLKNLLAFGNASGELWLSPTDGTLPAREVAAAYLGVDPTYRAAAETVKLGREKGKVVGNTSIARGVEIGQNTLKRWRASSEKAKSCAINTLAHELTHTVPAGGGASLFLDGGRRRATRNNRALVSYTVGAEIGRAHV